MSFGEDIEIRPAIIVVDKSGSMQGVLDAVGTHVNGLIARLTKVPSLRDTVALAVIEFDGETEVRRPLTRRGLAGTEFDFEDRRGATDFRGPLGVARHMIERDLPKLSSISYRPVVFFISDGGHNLDSFEEARRELLTIALPPKIAVFEMAGMDRDEATLRSLATAPNLYVPVAATEEAVAELIDKIYGTLGSVPGGGVAESYLEGEIDERGNQKLYHPEDGEQI